jgi:cellulose synthase/poly-beta-1,6-N-acetylglucosamine synthase-like glycosyltransferase
MIAFLNAANHALFIYYLVCNLIYLITLVVALKTSATHQRRLESWRLHWIQQSPLTSPITILAPAHNEESSIRVAVSNLLDLDYPEFEVIVINDGSEDRTLAELQEEFRLRPVRAVYVQEVLPQWARPAAVGNRQGSGGQQSRRCERRPECSDFALRLRRGCRLGA